MAQQVTRSEDVRDSNGVLTGTRVFSVDALGRESYVDVPISNAVGIAQSDVVAGVVDSVKASSPAPSRTSTPATTTPTLTTTQVKRIAQGKGSRVKDDDR